MSRASMITAVALVAALFPLAGAQAQQTAPSAPMPPGIIAQDDLDALARREHRLRQMTEVSKAEAEMEKAQAELAKARAERLEAEARIHAIVSQATAQPAKVEEAKSAGPQPNAKPQAVNPEEPLPRVRTISGPAGHPSAVLLFATGAQVTVRAGDVLPGGMKILSITDTTVKVRGPNGVKALDFIMF